MSRPDLTARGHPRPAPAADQVLLLIDGTLAAGATRPGINPAVCARELAEQFVVTSQGLFLKEG
ncbi:hypothetical protein [Nonomuraea dietziae]|uniref:hypothetical protein n=1 Tax=Nonomuraea dietziae TaxID=65515 RepID=UPI003404124C